MRVYALVAGSPAFDRTPAQHGAFPTTPHTDPYPCCRDPTPRCWRLLFLRITYAHTYTTPHARVPAVLPHRARVHLRGTGRGGVAAPTTTPDRFYLNTPYLPLPLPQVSATYHLPYAIWTVLTHTLPPYTSHHPSTTGLGPPHTCTPTTTLPTSPTATLPCLHFPLPAHPHPPAFPHLLQFTTPYLLVPALPPSALVHAVCHHLC